MRKRLLSWGVGALLFSVVGTMACSSGSTSQKTATGAPVPQAEAGQAYVDAICNSIAPCCQQNGFAYDQATCLANGPAFQAEFDKEVAKSVGKVYDAQKAGNCFAQLRVAVATCNPKSSDFDFEHSSECDGIFRGTVAPGGACTSSNECALAAGGEARCEKTSSSSGSPSTGRCIQLVPATEGVSCQSQTASTENVFGDCTYTNSETFFCDSRTSKCAKRLAVGESCFDEAGNVLYDGCLSSAFCNTVSKKCEAKVGPGGDCSTGSTNCLKGSYCDSSSKKCVALKKGGEACASEDGATCEHGCDTTTSKCRMNDISAKICAGKDLD